MRVRADLHLPVHDDISRLRQVFDQAFRRDLGHSLAGSVRPFAASVAQREGKRLPYGFRLGWHELPSGWLDRSIRRRWLIVHVCDAIAALRTNQEHCAMGSEATTMRCG